MCTDKKYNIILVSNRVDVVKQNNGVALYSLRSEN